MYSVNSLEEFNEKLEIELYFFTDIEIMQILDDYKDLFNEKKNSGKTEAEIIESFDSPKIIAKNYADELDIKTSNIKKEITKIRKKSKKWIDEIKESNLSNAKDVVPNDSRKTHLSNFKNVLICIIRFIILVVISLIKLILYVSIAIVIILFCLSLLLINLSGPYNIALRFLEFIIVISYIGIIIIILSYMKKEKNE